jgi:hypothetical protein
MVPLGYVSRDKKLFIEEEEAERVRTIFQGYLELGSIRSVLPVHWARCCNEVTEAFGEPYQHCRTRTCFSRT